MIKHPTPSEAFTFAVDPASVERLQIAVSGLGVTYFEMLAGTPIARKDAAMPDPVKLLANAVAMGLFASTDMTQPPGFEIMQQRLENETYHWDIAVKNLDPGAFKILVNLLIAREMDMIQITGTPHTELFIYPDKLAYAAAPLPQGFNVDYRPDEKRQSDREVALHFAAEPDDETLDQVYAMLECWAALPMFGGFPKAGTSALHSAALPELAALTEPTVLTQSFNEVFICDEAAFAPLITYFTTGKGRHLALRHIRIS